MTLAWQRRSREFHASSDQNAEFSSRGNRLRLFFRPRERKGQPKKERYLFVDTCCDFLFDTIKGAINKKSQAQTAPCGIINDPL